MEAPEKNTKNMEFSNKSNMKGKYFMTLVQRNDLFVSVFWDDEGCDTRILFLFHMWLADIDEA